MPRGPRNVSHRTLAELARSFESWGVDLETVVEGLPTTLAELRDPRAFSDWDTFITIIERMESASDRDAPFDDAIAEMNLNGAAARILSGFGIAMSVEQSYRLLYTWLAPSLFPPHRVTVSRATDRQLRVHLKILPEYRGSEAFMRSALGAARGLPELLGHPVPKIEARIGPHDSELLIALPPAQSIASRIERFARLVRDSNHVIDELARQQTEISMASDELDASYDRLRQREQDLADEVAEHERARAALRESEARLRHAEKLEAVGRLAGGIAHDFNNVMTIVQGYASDLGQRTSGDPDAAASVREINTAIRRAALLTRQLLTFSQRQLTSPRPVDVNDTVRGLSTMLSRLVGAQTELEIDLGPGPLVVRVDPTQLEQAVLNLAINARDAMTHGGALTIATEGVASGLVQIRVRDTGIGIDPDTLPKIFDPFFTTKAAGSGTGLGLANVYGIVKQGGGQIDVESRPGGGTLFVMSFPVATGEVAEATEPELLEASAETGRTVMIIEDESALRRLFTRLLEAEGYLTLSAAGGEEATALAAAHVGTIDLFVSDVLLRGERGPEVVNRLRERYPDAQALLISGYAGATDVHPIPSDWPFLGKPFTNEQLLAAVTRVLSSEDEYERPSGVDAAG